MTSFVKCVAVLCAAFVVAAALPGRADTDKPSKADGKDAAPKKDKSKRSKSPEGTPKKGTDVPVEKGHDSFGMFIPYFTPDGKRQMNFTIGVASRVDDNHIQMKNLQIETFDENGEHEMSIDLPTSLLNTDTSVITSRQHVTIRRSDFELTGEAMIFNTRTKQGGLGGGVHMLIYDLQNETADASKTSEPIAK